MFKSNELTVLPMHLALQLTVACRHELLHMLPLALEFVCLDCAVEWRVIMHLLVLIS